MPTNLWQPGQSGNLAGRTRGSRNKLSEEVVCALLRDFREHGQKAIAKVRRTQPAAYLKVLEPVGRHFGVPDGVLNVLVSEVMLQGPRVVTIIGQLEPAGMAKHVGVDREWHLGGLPQSLDKPVESNGADWPAALGNEYVGVFGIIAS